MFLEYTQVDSILNSRSAAVVGCMLPYDPIEVCHQLLDKGCNAGLLVPLPYITTGVNPFAGAKWDLLQEVKGAYGGPYGAFASGPW